MSDEEERAFVTLLNYTGADDLQGVLQVLSEERLGMAQLHDENNALRIYNRRLRLIVNYAIQVFDLVEVVGGLFLTEKIRKMIGISREQIKAADKVISESVGLCETTLTLPATTRSARVRRP